MARSLLAQLNASVFDHQIARLDREIAATDGMIATAARGAELAAVAAASRGERVAREAAAIEARKQGQKAAFEAVRDNLQARRAGLLRDRETFTRGASWLRVPVVWIAMSAFALVWPVVARLWIGLFGGEQHRGLTFAPRSYYLSALAIGAPAAIGLIAVS